MAKPRERDYTLQLMKDSVFNVDQHGRIHDANGTGTDRITFC